MKLFFAALTLLAFTPSFAGAQAVVVKPGHVLAWDQPATEGNPAQPSAYIYTLSIDGGNPTPLTATCTAGAENPALWHCTAPIPALTPGTRQLRIAASLEYEGSLFSSAGESEPLSVITIFIAVPVNPRLEPAPGGGGQ